MRVVQLGEILPVIQDKIAVREAVKQGFIQHAQGKITLPEPVQMLFGERDNALAGDCHIKTASSKDMPYFFVKVATGFYGNPSKGLPVNNGLVMLLCSKTGQPFALFQDKGHLTSARTAAAGALAASLRSRATPLTIGIIGTGHQAELQARWIAETQPVSRTIIWGRSQAKADILSGRLSEAGVKAETSTSIPKLCEQSDIIVTTTPSRAPLLFAADIKPGHHIIAMGSDSPGKIELEPEILNRADVILTDDHSQCLHHGEFGNAVRAGAVKASKDTSFGKALETPAILNLNTNSVSIVDLTGLGAQDLAIASMVYDNIR